MINVNTPNNPLIKKILLTLNANVGGHFLPGNRIKTIDAMKI